MKAVKLLIFVLLFVACQSNEPQNVGNVFPNSMPTPKPLDIGKPLYCIDNQFIYIEIFRVVSAGQEVILAVDPYLNQSEYPLTAKITTGDCQTTQNQIDINTFPLHTP